MLFLNNDEVAQVLTMKDTIDALEQAYRDLAAGLAVCRPRIDIRIPTHDPSKTYQWGTMEGGSSTSGYFAIRMKSDVIYQESYADTRTQEKYCVEPGLYCGLILLIDIQNAEPLAFINDGFLQHMRVGADSAIGAKYMAKEDAAVIGMIGSGGMARSHAEAFAHVRDIKRINVYSPTAAHREEYAAEIQEQLGIETVAVDSAQAAHEGADILAGCTDAVTSVIFGRWIGEGTHVTSVGGRLDGDAMERIDRSLRLGSAPAPIGLPELELHDELLAYEAKGTPGGARQAPDPFGVASPGQGGGRAHGIVADDRVVFMEQLLSGAPGRSSPGEVTYSARGNIQGAQFFAVASRAYELAKERGLGRSIPTDWLLQDIRD